MTLISQTKPKARKVHHCDFCYGAIMPSTRYIRQANKVDGDFGVFICHEHCQEVAHRLDMYDDVDPDYGLTDEMFGENIDQYIYDNHYDDEADDIATDWQNLSREEELMADVASKNDLK